MANQVVLFRGDIGSADQWSVGERLRHLGPGEEPEGQDSKFARSWELWKVCEQESDITGPPSPQKPIGSTEQCQVMLSTLQQKQADYVLVIVLPFPGVKHKLPSCGLLESSAGLASSVFFFSHGFLTCSQIISKALGGFTHQPQSSGHTPLSFFQQTFPHLCHCKPSEWQ